VVDLVLVALFFALFTCLVDNDGEVAPVLFVADLVEDKRELLRRRDDDLLAVLGELSRRSPERSACPTVAPIWAYCLMVSWICRSRRIRSVTTMIEPKMLLPTFCNPISW